MSTWARRDVTPPVLEALRTALGTGQAAGGEELTVRCQEQWVVGE